MTPTLHDLRNRTVTLIEQDIKVNNDLLTMALRIEDPRIRAAALERIEEGIRRTREIISLIMNEPFKHDQ